MNIQYISDENGNTTGVIIPIDLWQTLLSERETAYLLKSDAMKQRLLEARKRNTGINLEQVCEKLGI